MAGLFEATQKNRNKMPPGAVYDAKYKTMLANAPANQARAEAWRAEYKAGGGPMMDKARADQEAATNRYRNSGEYRSRASFSPPGYSENERMEAFLPGGGPEQAERRNRWMQMWGSEAGGTLGQAQEEARRKGWDTVQPGAANYLSNEEWAKRYPDRNLKTNFDGTTYYQRGQGPSNAPQPPQAPAPQSGGGTSTPQERSNIWNPTGAPPVPQSGGGTSTPQERSNIWNPTGAPPVPQSGGGTSTPQERSNIWNPTGAPPVPQSGGGTSTPQEIANIWNPTGAPPVPQSGGQPYDNGPQMNMLPQGIGSLLRFLASRKGYGFGGYGGGGGGINRGGQMQSWQIPGMIA